MFQKGEVGFVKTAGPGGQKGLVKKIFITGIGSAFAVDLPPVSAIFAGKGGGQRGPFFGHFRQNIKTASGILSPFGVVSGGRVQRMRLLLLPVLVALMK